MKQYTLALLIFSLLAFPDSQWAQLKNAVDNCYTCHQALGDRQAELFENDVHRKIGISCAGCHGGDRKTEDMEIAMSKARGFIGVPKGDEISVVCAKCHSDPQIMIKEFNSPLRTNQSELLAKSVHGRLSITGKEHIVQCTTCHNSHGIVRVSNPSSPVNPRNVPRLCSKCHSDAAYMRSYNPALPVDQLEKYRTSVHGIRNVKGDQKVAECASCHGSHDVLPAGDVKSRVYPTTIPTTCAKCHSDPKYMSEYNIGSAQLEQYAASVHGIALLEKGDIGAPSCNDCHGNHGAVPPGVESISKVCGTCHALNASLFASSPHKKAFDKRKLPECETCHGYHDIVAAKDELLGVSSEAVCSWCHKADTPDKGYVVARTMRQFIDSLTLSEHYAQSLVGEAEQKGMEVSEAKFKLRSVRQARLESRTMVHSFNEQKFQEVVENGLTAASSIADEAQEAIDEYYFRRWGMAVSTLIITVVAVSLYLTIRRIERQQKAQP